MAICKKCGQQVVIGEVYHRECIEAELEQLQKEKNELLCRLAEYENTELPPDVCAEYKKFEDEAVGKGVTFKRIVELMNAEAEGRLVVLPCKVGDTVYISGHKFAAQIDEIVINAMDGITLNWSEYDKGPELTELWDDGWFTPEDIGKTVFLTREEAEATLKGGAE